MSGCTVHKVDLTAATWCVRAGAALKMLSDLPLTRDLHSSFMLLSQFLPSPQVLHLCSSKHAACSRLLSFSKGSILPSLFMKKNIKFHLEDIAQNTLTSQTVKLINNSVRKG